jgi:hypothetical protein
LKKNYQDAILSVKRKTDKEVNDDAVLFEITSIHDKNYVKASSFFFHRPQFFVSYEAAFVTAHGGWQ